MDLKWAVCIEADCPIFLLGGKRMATTRIIAMHRNKGCTAEQALKARLDYIKNPEKTREGELVTAFACHAATADAEFALARKEYFEITGRWREDEVIAYQIRQSFKPGEVSPEDANRLGYELVGDIEHPDQFKLSPIQRGFWQSAINKAPTIHHQKIEHFLSKLQFPLYFFDYETVGSAIPMSSLARIIRRRATNRGSSPATSIRAR